jgi:hypothetical protein
MLSFLEYWHLIENEDFLQPHEKFAFKFKLRISARSFALVTARNETTLTLKDPPRGAFMA